MSAEAQSVDLQSAERHDLVTLPREVGRPSSYSEQLAEYICELLENGHSLRKICETPGVPHRSTVLRWQRDNPEFAARCARAREAQGDYMDDLVLDTANECTSETAHAAKVKISAYQWRAAKLKPKVYGDSTTIAHTVDARVAGVNLNVTDPIEAARVYQSLIAGK